MDTFEKFINSKNISLKFARGVSSMKGREFHPYNEIIYFFGESAYLFSETVSTVIRPNTLIVIPKETYHQLNIIGKEDEYERCVLHFYDIPEIDELIKNTLKELYITETNEGLNFLFDRLKKIADKNDEENTDEILKAVLILVLNEFKSENIVHQTVPEVNSLVQKSVLYIAENIGDDLSISRISKHLNISESLLSHIFKDEMNISIHRYILKKRLITAFEKISSGCPATVAAAECGFSEYSNFYRQYKKAFGFPPSAKDYTLK